MMARRFRGGEDAGEHSLAVHQNGARSALRFTASDLRPGEAEAASQYIGKHLLGLDLQAHFAPVDPQAELLHARPRPSEMRPPRGRSAVPIVQRASKPARESVTHRTRQWAPGSLSWPTIDIPSHPQAASDSWSAGI